MLLYYVIAGRYWYLIGKKHYKISIVRAFLMFLNTIYLNTHCKIGKLILYSM